MHKVIISLLLLAVFSACNAATAETDRNYDYRAQSSETRKLLTRQQEINRELYRGEITRGEAAALKFRARQNHLNAINVIRSQRYAEERQPFIQPQQLQQRYKLTPEASCRFSL